jgi:hypothetical protein
LNPPILETATKCDEILFAAFQLRLSCFVERLMSASVIGKIPEEKCFRVDAFKKARDRRR